MLMNNIIENVKDFEFYPDRAKVSGRMYGGRATAEINGIIFHLELWYHGGDNETKESLIDKLSIKAITIGDQFYDIGWYCIITQNELWLNKDGWFGFEPEQEELQKFAHNQMGTTNHNFPQNVVVDSAAAIERGFVRIL